MFGGGCDGVDGGVPPRDALKKGKLGKQKTGGSRALDYPAFTNMRGGVELPFASSIKFQARCRFLKRLRS